MSNEPREEVDPGVLATLSQADGDQMKSTLNQFTDAAPNLPFKLPFGLDKLFHVFKSKGSTSGDKP